MPNRSIAFFVNVFSFLLVFALCVTQAQATGNDNTQNSSSTSSSSTKTLVLSPRITPGPNWSDSYSHNGQCYCASTFDHGAGNLRVATPEGVKTVRQICARIGPGPGVRGNPVYNDVQCGHGPPNNAGDEHVCPGRVDMGAAGCNIKGPTWNLTRFYSNTSRPAPQPPAPDPEPRPEPEPEPRPEPEPEPRPEPEPEPQPAPEPEPRPAPEPEPRPEPEPEPRPEPEPEPRPEPEPEPRPEPEPQPAPEPQPVVVDTPMVETTSEPVAPEEVDSPPTINAIDNLSVNVGEEVSLLISAADDDGSVPALYLESAPAGSTLDDNGDGTRTFRWMPDTQATGTVDVVLVAADADRPELMTRESFAITVLAEVVTEMESTTVMVEDLSSTEAGGNRLSVNVVGPAIAEIGRAINIRIRVVSDDGLMPELSILDLPMGAETLRNDDGSYSVLWTPSVEQIGFHDMSVALDIERERSASVLRNMRVVVVESLSENRAPYFEMIGAQQLLSNVPFEMVVRPVDPEGIAPALQVVNAPAGATFADNLDGSRTLRWTPGEEDRGEVTITFVAIDHDDEGLSATESVVLTVQ